MTSRLSLYNGALRLLGQRKLSSLTENSPARHLLDEAWNGGAQDYCLEAGQWKFAIRAVRMDASPSSLSEDEQFGYQYAFNIPTDHLRLVGMYANESMRPDDALLDYREENGYWFCDQETIYVRFVSNHASFGADLSLWPQSFVKYVEAHLAVEIAMGLTNDTGKRDDMLSMRSKILLPDAKSRDAMQDPPKFQPTGSWTRARMGGSSRRGEGRH